MSEHIVVLNQTTHIVYLDPDNPNAGHYYPAMIDGALTKFVHFTDGNNNDVLVVPPNQLDYLYVGTEQGAKDFIIERSNG